MVHLRTYGAQDASSCIDKLERASHLSKDAGELCACTEALLIFSGVFHEA